MKAHFPMSSIETIGSVMLQDVVGDYDVPEEVPEWSWIEANASYSHQGNGLEPGVWEFVLNLTRDFQSIPDRLAAVIAQARQRKLAYLILHQG